MQGMFQKNGENEPLKQQHPSFRAYKDEFRKKMLLRNNDMNHIFMSAERWSLRVSLMFSSAVHKDFATATALHRNSLLALLFPIKEQNTSSLMSPALSCPGRNLASVTLLSVSWPWKADPLDLFFGTFAYSCSTSLGGWHWNCFSFKTNFQKKKTNKQEYHDVRRTKRNNSYHLYIHFFFHCREWKEIEENSEDSS